MLRVGLTGGIGAGKSTVARRLAEHGAVVVDSDVIAREVVEPGTDGLARIVEAFGDGVLAADGSLDRPALAALVFGGGAGTGSSGAGSSGATGGSGGAGGPGASGAAGASDGSARATLNGIVHPLVRARSAEIVAAAAPDAVVVHDIPLLVEGGMAAAFHLVLVVHAPADVRVERLVGRGLGADDARARIAAQASDEQRRAAADVWLDNGGWPDAIEAAADELWAERLVPFEANVRLRRPGDRPTAVVEARAEWAEQGRRLAARLSLAAGGLPVEHVGPTSIPGTPAPDVLEFEIATGSGERPGDEARAALGEALEDAGFPFDATGDAHRSADPGRAAVVRLVDR